ncbi:MAG: ATP-binding cassette domain-containing protein [Comamonadaceae bacterium]|nr:ATP-binding cassette domain-containing protein [Comamonadaceae bacterium]
MSKVYRMGEVEVHALRGVDLDLYAGEFVVLLGPSGSGKSTLLNILGGLDTPTSGEVRLPRPRPHRRRRARSSTRYRREHVGFVFQFYNLIPSLTARENVALVTEIAERPMRPERGARAGRAGRPARPLPGAALGRRAAARGDRARHRQAARRAAVRRADRRARLRHRQGGAGGASSASTASWAPPPW